MSSVHPFYTYFWIMLSCLCSVSAELVNQKFPDNFMFGAVTSAYQCEGGWNEGGRGESMWDHSLQENPDYIQDKTNGSIASDSYHKWREDVRLLKGLNAQFYRFSISWSRVLPSGYRGSKVNEEGVQYYNNLINELLAANVKPFVTIYHWDLPQVLNERGGWLNSSIVDDFVYYSKTLFELFGDRVKHWITVNEIFQICQTSYAYGVFAPFMKLPYYGGYQCTHNVLLAHGKTYKLYERQFKPKQKGEISLTVQSFWCEPETDSQEDKEASERFLEFNIGWFLHPIYKGNYPPSVIDKINELNQRSENAESMIPFFTSDEIDIIKGTMDFFGLNHYTTMTCTTDENSTVLPYFHSDAGVRVNIMEGKDSVVDIMRDVPWGLRKVLVWIKKTYNNPTVIITENGWPSSGIDLEDTDRVNYHKGYLAEVLKAIYLDGCNVVGYTAWSLIDLFEWSSGYKLHFGLVYVDFNSKNRTRIPRRSYYEYKNIVTSRQISTNNSL
ncbi:hypothetical protein WA026_015721 [Henosepilachna vigintioctopunctata]|uniref:Beta-glucosidase n=1 Tax=Henosepilachna vigintioctopunctata TaxID=420089 RepID=A0AAW1V1P3_9CUCU